MIKIYNANISGFASVCGASLGALFGGFDLALQTLLLMIVIDYLSGVFKAIKNKDLKSGAMYDGAIKKIGIFIVIMVANSIDNMGFMSDPILRNGAVFFFIANESISILENLFQLGVKIPTQLLNILHIVESENDKGVDE